MIKKFLLLPLLAIASIMWAITGCAGAETPDGKGFEKAVDFMFPYLKNPFDWKYRQISGDVETAPTFLQIGGYRLGRQDWLSHYRSRRKNRLPFIVDYCYPPLMVGYFEKR